MSAKAAIYLDANAAAPLKPEVSQALLSLLGATASSSGGGISISSSGALHNPSSVHSHGRHAKRLLSRAREQVAASLGPDFFPEDLTFTSSGTEANQLAIRLALEPGLLRGEKPHWILSPVEHDSVLQMVKWFEARGGSVSYLPVDAQGRPGLERLGELWRPETALLSLIWVNNETGVISEVRPALEFTAQRGIWMHLDGAQAWGKLPVSDTLSARAGGRLSLALSGHKIGALAGTGALWVSPGARERKPGVGTLLGKQERGARGGTENLLGGISLGVAAEGVDPLAWASRVLPLRERLENAICERIPGTWVNGAQAPRVANTLNLSFAGVERDGLVAALDLAGFSVSSGSACSSGVAEPSHVLLAMGRTPAQAASALRISLVDELEWRVLEEFVGALSAVIGKIRAMAAKPGF